MFQESESACLKLSSFNKERLLQIQKLMANTRFNGERFYLHQASTLLFLLKFIDQDFLLTLNQLSLHISSPEYSNDLKSYASNQYIQNELKEFINNIDHIQIIFDISTSTIEFTWNPYTVFSYNYSIDFYILILIELSKYRICQLAKKELSDIITNILKNYHL